MGPYSLRFSHQCFIYILPSLVFLSAFLAPRFLAFLPTICGLIGIGSLLITKKHITLWRLGYLYAFACIAFSAISILWSYNPEFSTERVLKFIPLAFFGLLLPSYILSIKDNVIITPSKFILSIAIPASIASLALIFEYYNQFPIYAALHPETDMSVKNFFVYNRSAVALFLLLLPALFLFAASYKNFQFKKQIFILLIPFIFLFFLTTSQTAQIGLLTGLTVFLIAPVKNKIFQYSFIGLLTIGCLTAPYTVQKIYKIEMGDDHSGIMTTASIPHRIEVWNFALTEGMKNPVYGSGIGSLRFIESEQNQLQRYMKGTSVLHPHNVVVQAWQEFGLIGALLLTTACILILRKIFSYPKPIARLYLGLFSAYSMIALTGYGFWQSWIIGTFLLLCSFGFLTAQIIRKNLESAPNSGPAIS